MAAKLNEYSEQSLVVLAIPNGGIPVAIEVARMLKAELGLVICRKISLNLNPEGTLGATTDDGTVILNEAASKRTGLSRQELEYEVNQVRADIKQRSLLYKADLPLVRVSGKTVIIVDDGLASGYTMTAAIESVRHRRVKEIIAAAPVTSAIARKQVEKVADKLVTCATGYMSKFYVANYYHYWNDISDEDVVRYLKEWRIERLRPNL